jgi:hypothetical protein
MLRSVIKTDSPVYETVDGRKYTTCGACDEVIDLTPAAQFTFETVVYGNGFAVRAYCSLVCVERMIRSAIEAVAALDR